MGFLRNSFNNTTRVEVAIICCLFALLIVLSSAYPSDHPYLTRRNRYMAFMQEMDDFMDTFFALEFPQSHLHLQEPAFAAVLQDDIDDDQDDSDSQSAYAQVDYQIVPPYIQSSRYETPQTHYQHNELAAHHPWSGLYDHHPFFNFHRQLHRRMLYPYFPHQHSYSDVQHTGHSCDMYYQSPRSVQTETDSQGITQDASEIANPEIVPNEIAPTPPSSPSPSVILLADPAIRPTHRYTDPDDFVLDDFLDTSLSSHHGTFDLADQVEFNPVCDANLTTLASLIKTQLDFENEEQSRPSSSRRHRRTKHYHRVERNGHIKPVNDDADIELAELEHPSFKPSAFRTFASRFTIGPVSDHLLDAHAAHRIFTNNEADKQEDDDFETELIDPNPHSTLPEDPTAEQAELAQDDDKTVVTMFLPPLGPLGPLIGPAIGLGGCRWGGGPGCGGGCGFGGCGGQFVGGCGIGGCGGGGINIGINIGVGGGGGCGFGGCGGGGGCGFGGCGW